MGDSGGNGCSKGGQYPRNVHGLVCLCTPSRGWQQQQQSAGIGSRGRAGEVARGLVAGWSSIHNPSVSQLKRTGDSDGWGVGGSKDEGKGAVFEKWGIWKFSISEKRLKIFPFLRINPDKHLCFNKKAEVAEWCCSHIGDNILCKLNPISLMNTASTKLCHLWVAERMIIGHNFCHLLRYKKILNLKSKIDRFL
jgi:hypothetical protein